MFWFPEFMLLVLTSYQIPKIPINLSVVSFGANYHMTFIPDSLMMQHRPTSDQLLEFFKSDVFRQEHALRGDFTQAIAEFYKRFYPGQDQSRYNEIGIQINRTLRKPIIIEEENDSESQVQAADDIEYRSDIYFEYLQNPGQELSFSLIGHSEEQAFYNATKAELLDFFVFKFRRYSKLLIY